MADFGDEFGEGSINNVWSMFQNRLMFGGRRARNGGVGTGDNASAGSGTGVGSTARSHGGAAGGFGAAVGTHPHANDGRGGGDNATAGGAAGTDYDAAPKYCRYTASNPEEASVVADALEKDGLCPGHIEGEKYIVFEKAEFNSVVESLQTSFPDIARALCAGNYSEFNAWGLDDALRIASGLSDAQRPSLVCRHDLTTVKAAQETAIILEDAGIEVGYSGGTSLLFYPKDIERIALALETKAPDVADKILNERLSRFKANDIAEGIKKSHDFDVRHQKGKPEVKPQIRIANPHEQAHMAQTWATQAQSKAVGAAEKAQEAMIDQEVKFGEARAKGVKVPKTAAEAKASDAAAQAQAAKVKADAAAEYAKGFSAEGWPLPKTPAKSKPPTLDERLDLAKKLSDKQAGLRSPQKTLDKKTIARNVRVK